MKTCKLTQAGLKGAQAALRTSVYGIDLGKSFSMKNIVFKTLLGVALVTSVACKNGFEGSTNSQVSSELATVNQNASSIQEQINNLNPEGVASGGGGYVDENSKIIIERAAGGLARMILEAEPNLWQGLPGNMTQKKLAQLIKEVKLEPKLEIKSQKDQVTGEIKEKMFHYRVIKGQPEIVALRPFFHIYSSVAVKFKNDFELVETMRDIQLKLAHEVAHFIPGIEGHDEKAEIFGRSLLQSIYENVHLCSLSILGSELDKVNMPVYYKVDKDSVSGGKDLITGDKLKQKYNIVVALNLNSEPTEYYGSRSFLTYTTHFVNENERSLKELKELSYEGLFLSQSENQGIADDEQYRILNFNPTSDIHSAHTQGFHFMSNFTERERKNGVIFQKGMRPGVSGIDFEFNPKNRTYKTSYMHDSSCEDAMKKIKGQAGVSKELSQYITEQCSGALKPINEDLLDNMFAGSREEESYEEKYIEVFNQPMKCEEKSRKLMTIYNENITKNLNK